MKTLEAIFLVMRPGHSKAFPLFSVIHINLSHMALSHDFISQSKLIPEFFFICSNYNFNVGIKHVFLCINICWALRMVLKPNLEGEGFNDPIEVKQMLVYQKTMFDCYYCIKSF